MYIYNYLYLYLQIVIYTYIHTIIYTHIHITIYILRVYIYTQSVHTSRSVHVSLLLLRGSLGRHAVSMIDGYGYGWCGVLGRHAVSMMEIVFPEIMMTIMMVVLLVMVVVVVVVVEGIKTYNPYCCSCQQKRIYLDILHGIGLALIACTSGSFVLSEFEALIFWKGLR